MIFHSEDIAITLRWLVRSQDRTIYLPPKAVPIIQLYNSHWIFYHQRNLIILVVVVNYPMNQAVSLILVMEYLFQIFQCKSIQYYWIISQIF